jgi:Leucine-rich repeat (LRR) protein
MLIPSVVVVILACALLNAQGGHVPGREGKCEFSNEYSPMLGNVYTCRIRNAVINGGSEKFTITGTHPTKGRKDLGVKFVEFVSSNISHLPDQIFRKFPNIEYLNANGIGLKTFKPSKVACDLKVISLNNNLMTQLESNTFAFSTQLFTLNIRKNLIEEIAVDTFRDLTHLKELHLSDNKLSSLHMNTFSSLISLEILALSGNQLQIIDLELLQSNVQLNEILLYDNKITSMHPQVFCNMANLFNLELHGNVCVDRDIRIEDGEFQELVKSSLKVCVERYPGTQ